MSQSYANHRRIDPAYHWVAFGLWILLLVVACMHAYHHIAGSKTMIVLLVFLFILMLKIRTYALRVQDRVIRLEETLRMRAILPAAQQADIARLRPGQFVALRFAADGELAERVAEALREDLKGEAIKKRIQTWRPDEFRV